MFSYYGGKSKIIKKYPAPKYDTIIEPFAGSARYGLLYSEKSVILNDSYKVISDIWNYLINATEEQIKNLPNLQRGENLKDVKNITDVERNLLGFMVNRGVPYPHNIYTTWAFETGEINKTKQKILNNLSKIRHWKVFNKSYEELDNIEATWFIDPPYQVGGERYIKNKIDYSHLSNWIKSLKGQVIVCENSSATWMDFKPLVKLTGQKKTTTEVIWTNNYITEVK